VSVGNDVVGVVHPCKVYGAMAVARPILLLGPNPCHVSDLVDTHRLGWHISHGDVDGAVKQIEAAAALSRRELMEIGMRCKAVIERELSKEILCGKFCNVVERVLAGKGAVARPDSAAAGAAR
jgi:colanic acid biosynthesis glycosyl transferase WcaI